MPVKKPTVVKFGGLTLNLQLTGRNVINIESRLKESMVGLFLNPEGGLKMPPTGKLLIVLQGANTTHGVSDDDIIDAFEKYIDEGNTPMDLMTVVQNLLDVSGFLGSKVDKKEPAKKESGKVVSLDAPEAPVNSPLD